MTTPTDSRWRALNRAALGLAVLLLVAIAALWAWDQLRPLPRPRFEAREFAAIRTADALAPARERWLVAVNPSCPHCRRHFAWLASRVAGRASPPALGAIVVDEPRRPDTLTLAGPAPAGLWWDSAGVWRRGWGRRLYGETYRFDSNGRLLGLARVDELPDSAGVAPAPAPASEGR